MKKLALVIPAYNEAKNLPELLRRAMEAATESGLSSSEFTLVLVNNGSTDNSLAVIAELQKKNAWGDQLQLVNVEKNQGYGHGIMTGLKAAQAEILGWTHADLQCDPANAFLAFRQIADTSSKTLVKGTRSGRAFQERFVSWVFGMMAGLLLGLKTKEVNAQPKVFPQSLRDHLLTPPRDFALDLYLLHVAQENGYSVKEIPVLFPPRIHGISNWAGNFAGRYKTIWGMILYMWKLRREGRKR